MITKTPEHEVVLNVALRLAERLQARGVKATLTRDRAEVSLSNAERARLATEVGADLTVRLHCDGVRGVMRPLGFFWHGSLTLVPGRAHVAESLWGDSRRVGELLHPAMVRATGFHDRGIVERTDLAGFNWSSMPVVLLELGYLTNPREERRLVGTALQDGIASTLSETLVCKVPRALGVKP